MQKDLEIAAFVSSNYQQKELEKLEEKLWRQELEVFRKRIEFGIWAIALVLLAGSIAMMAAAIYGTWFV